MSTDDTRSLLPAITTPVSRHLIVGDVARSVAFYRDVLGFDERPATEAYGAPVAIEVVRGPARIHLGEAPGGAASGGPPRAIVFIETADVAAMRAAVVARGGAAGELADVNWIKMRMFEVRDPDGNVLWFGQSFQEPGAAAPPPMLRTIMPEMPLDDVSAGVAHYRDVLGFSVNYAQHDIGVMDRDEARILLIARTSRHTGIGSCYIYVRDADALHAELRSRGANVQGAPESMPWGLRQFFVLDLEGNRIGFGQTFE